MKPHEWTDGGDKVLILRRCNADMSSYNGFVWPASGPVEFSDFNASKSCGGGGHGWAWGMGLGEGKDYDIITDKWLVVAALPDDVVGEIDDGVKCKIRRGEVVFCGAFSAAWALVNSGRHRLITAMVDDAVKETNAEAASSQLAASGASSKLAASGYSSQLAASGASSKLAASGYSSKLAASGKDSVAACVGPGSKVAVGERGAFAIAYKTDGGDFRFLCGKVGEEGIKSNTYYEVVDGKLSECK